MRPGRGQEARSRQKDPQKSEKSEYTRAEGEYARLVLEKGTVLVKEDSSKYNAVTAYLQSNEQYLAHERVRSAAMMRPQVHCTLYAVLCTHDTLCTHHTHYTLYSVLTLHTLYSLCTLYSVLTLHTLYSLCTLCTHSARYTHSAHYTLYSLYSLCTLYPLPDAPPASSRIDSWISQTAEAAGG
jgi:hypothetical protein